MYGLMITVALSRAAIEYTTLRSEKIRSDFDSELDISHALFCVAL